MQIILASTNDHKAQELSVLLSGSSLNITASSQKFEVVEDGATFEENAFKKASFYYQKLSSPVMADDSGLVIPARPDILGVHSARYAPDCEDYREKNLRLLEDISKLEGEERKAYFVCVLCFYLSAKEVFFFEGRVHGSIALAPAGEDGFGYDPVFLPEGNHDNRSLAQLSQWKMANSHRAKACESAVKFFNGYFNIAN